MATALKESIGNGKGKSASCCRCNYRVLAMLFVAINIILASLVTVLLSSCVSLVIIAAFDMLGAFGILFAHCLGKPRLYTPFFVINSIGMLINILGIVVVVIVVLAYKKEQQYEFSRWLNVQSGGLGEAIVYHVDVIAAEAGIRIIDANNSAFLHLCCWIALFLSALLVRIVFHWVASRAYGEFKEGIEKGSARVLRSAESNAKKPLLVKKNPSVV